MDKGERVQIEILKKFSGEKRVYLGAELYEMAVQLIKDGLCQRHPELKKEDIETRAKEIMSPWLRKEALHKLEKEV